MNHAMTSDELRAWMEEKGLSQRKFAKWLGVTYRTVNRWATGKGKIPEYLSRIKLLEDYTKQ
jgi:DNA-binding transcriptional regulator YiaG